MYMLSGDVERYKSLVIVDWYEEAPKINADERKSPHAVTCFILNNYVFASMFIVSDIQIVRLVCYFTS